MRDDDRVDHDGVDIVFLDDDGGAKRPINDNSGCCVLLLVLGSMLGAGWLNVVNIMIL